MWITLLLVGFGFGFLVSSKLLRLYFSKHMNHKAKNSINTSQNNNSNQIPISSAPFVQDDTPPAFLTHHQPTTSDSSESQRQRNFDILLQDLLHELNTPLTSILGFSQLLKEETKKSTQAHDLSRRIFRQSNTLNNMIGALSLLHNKAPEAQGIQFSLVELLNECRAQIKDRTEYRDREIHLSPTSPIPIPSLYGMPALIQLCVNNLVINALKYSSTQSLVEIRYAVVTKRPDPAATATTDIVIEIHDSGKGIPVQNLRQIFTRHYREEDSHERGFGLGLDLCKRALQVMNGNITIESKVDQGTIVRLSIASPKIETSENHAGT